jgi:hypothetical protein
MIEFNQSNLKYCLKINDKNNNVERFSEKENQTNERHLKVKSSFQIKS